MGPAKLPQAIVTKVNEEVNKALTSGSLRERLLQEGYFLAPGTPRSLRVSNTTTCNSRKDHC